MNSEEWPTEEMRHEMEERVDKSLIIWEEFTPEEQEHVLKVVDVALEHLRNSASTWVRWTLSKEGPHVKVSPEILLTDIQAELTALKEDR